MAVTRRRTEMLDAADPLAGFRERFELRDGPIYVDGNSLGRPPAATRERLAELHEQWAQRLVGGWADWIELPLAVGELIGRDLLGAQPGETIACDSVTVNLYKLATAALDDRPGAIVTDRGNFPTDRYVLAGVAKRAGREYVEVDAPGVLDPASGELAL